MRWRKHRQRYVIGTKLLRAITDDRLLHPCKVVVAEHGDLGRARDATGRQQESEVIWVNVENR